MIPAIAITPIEVPFVLVFVCVAVIFFLSKPSMSTALEDVTKLSKALEDINLRLANIQEAQNAHREWLQTLQETPTSCVGDSSVPPVPSLPLDLNLDLSPPSGQYHIDTNSDTESYIELEVVDDDVFTENNTPKGQIYNPDRAGIYDEVYRVSPASPPQPSHSRPLSQTYDRRDPFGLNKPAVRLPIPVHVGQQNYLPGLHVRSRAAKKRRNRKAKQRLQAKIRNQLIRRRIRGPMPDVCP